MYVTDPGITLVRVPRGFLGGPPPQVTPTFFLRVRPRTKSDNVEQSRTMSNKVGQCRTKSDNVEQSRTKWNKVGQKLIHVIRKNKF